MPLEGMQSNLPHVPARAIFWHPYHGPTNGLEAQLILQGLTTVAPFSMIAMPVEHSTRGQRRRQRQRLKKRMSRVSVIEYEETPGKLDR